MTYFNTRSRPDGLSTIQRVELDFTVGDPAGRVFPADHLLFTRIPAGSLFDWHPAPPRQFVITLQGTAEVTASDGSHVTSSPGTAVLVEDLTGKGHQTRIPESADRVMVSVHLPFADGSRPAASHKPSPRKLEPLRIPRLYTTPDGGTSFDEVEIDLSGDASSPWFRQPVQSVTFGRLPAGFFADWHTEARRQLVVTLRGEADVVTTDGQRRTATPGTVTLVEDLEGKGHQTIVPDHTDRIVMLLALG